MKMVLIGYIKVMNVSIIMSVIMKCGEVMILIFHISIAILLLIVICDSSAWWISQNVWAVDQEGYQPVAIRRQGAREEKVSSDTCVKEENLL